MGSLRTTRYQQISTWLLISAIVMLPFSYHPLISLGQVAGVHIDGSLLYIVVALATICSLTIIWKHRRLLPQNKPFLLLVLLTAYATVSSVWSDNPFRSVITAAFLALLVGLVGSIAVQWPAIARHARPLRILVASTLGLSIAWSLWQIFGDAIGVDSTLTLLPSMYQSAVFGVARPTGFALEPQFFASILLIPFFWLAWQHLTKRGEKQSYPFLVAFIATGSILLLTLSRGGIYAAILGLVVLFVFEHHHIKRWLALIVSLLLSAVVSSAIVFAAATINQHDKVSGYESLSKAANQLSLGVVTLPGPQSSTISSPHHKETLSHKKEGYVTSSTESRTSMSREALALWTRHPQTILFGIGIGSFGATLHAVNDSYPVDSVVNNYYLELLVETGLIGIGLFLAFVISALYQLAKRRSYLLVALLTSLFVQLCFFSGNANIVHLWVVIGVAIASLLSQPKNKPRLVQ